MRRRDNGPRNGAVRRSLTGLAWLTGGVALAGAAARLIVEGAARGLGRRATPPTAPAPAEPRLLPAPDGASTGPAINVAGGRGLLIGLSTLLVIALLLVAGVEAIALDRRPKDFDQPLPPTRLIHAELLEGYAWVDEPGGAVRIPIDRAMELLAERGLPARPVEAGLTYRDRGQGGPTDSSGGHWPPQQGPAGGEP